ncbi:MAG: hypothetical protein U5Q16_00665 [Gammaproteobacteria bacterium]|nr:hypothetical protein [Gammaproteobacteria bacterium]
MHVESGIAQAVCVAAHGGEKKCQLLPMIGVAPALRLVLDHDHRNPAAAAEMRRLEELIAENHEDAV